MRKVISLLHTDKKLLLQFLFVFIAFSTMVLLGSVFGAGIVSKNVESYGEAVIKTSVEALNAYLYESKIIMNDTAFALERIKNRGGGPDEILAEMLELSEQLYNKTLSVDAHSGFYGMADGVYLDSDGWEPSDDYVPESRPWYIGALNKNGAVSYADPYIDALSGKYVITVSQLLLDENGKFFGIIAFDVYISGIYDLVNNLSLMNSGYGVLLDSNRRLVIHPVESFIGQQFENINGGAGGYAEIGSLLALGKDISAFQFSNYDQIKSVAFFGKLSPGWYVGIISPNKVYMQDVISMVALLSAVGFVLMVFLCALLAFVHMQKKRSDEANTVKSSFLANMSHEIRTPMNSIIGMTELLLHEPLSDRQKGYVNDINSSAHSLLSIINDILDLSKIETGKLELAPVDYNFPAFVANISSMFSFVAREKGLEFTCEEIGEMPKCLFGDDLRLRQVLTNICGNAVKFTSKGYIRLKVTTTEETIMFEIKDSGIGIRREDIPKLFDSFVQADIIKNRGTVGTGLGLSISKSFVEMMGGRILVDSVYGEGTSFTVVIPKKIGDESKIKYEEKKEKGRFFSAPTAKILVVDDNEVNLKVASGLLNLFNIQAVTAPSGMEAIKLVQEVDYDIVLMDHMMPEMDGIEAMNEIRKLGGTYKRLAIIALTATAIHGAKEMFLSNGFDDFISKPINVDDLAHTLNTWLPFAKIERKDEPDIAENTVSVGFLDSIKKIGAINTEIGLSHVSGLEDMYRETVEIFCKKLSSECDKMEGFLLIKDIHNLAISVHGMKSSLSTVGAMELSGTAFELENAAKAGDIPYCEEHLPAFLERLRSLQNQIAEALPSAAASLPLSKGTAELLEESIQNALAAVDAFDMDAGIEAVSRALEFDYGGQTNELLANAKGAFMDFDFDAAAGFLNKCR